MRTTTAADPTTSRTTAPTYTLVSWFGDLDPPVLSPFDSEVYAFLSPPVVEVVDGSLRPFVTPESVSVIPERPLVASAPPLALSPIGSPGSDGKLPLFVRPLVMESSPAPFVIESKPVPPFVSPFVMDPIPPELPPVMEDSAPPLVSELKSVGRSLSTPAPPFVSDESASVLGKPPGSSFDRLSLPMAPPPVTPERPCVMEPTPGRAGSAASVPFWVAVLPPVMVEKSMGES